MEDSSRFPRSATTNCSPVPRHRGRSSAPPGDPVLEPPAKRIGEQLLGDSARKLLRSSSSRARSPARPSRSSPSSVVLRASMGRPDSSTVRHAPMASNCSSANPSGSITEWQLAQLGFVRCCANRSRIVAGGASGLVSARFVSTPGGGGGAGRPRMLFNRNLPRKTGDVRSG